MDEFSEDAQDVAQDEQTDTEQQSDTQQVEQRPVADLETVQQVVEQSVSEGMREHADTQSASVDDLARSVDALVAAQAAEGDTSVGDGPVTVVMSDTQWAEMREAWLFAKGGMQVCLYLALVCTLLVASLLGNRLWSAFSQGWRR